MPPLPLPPVRLPARRVLAVCGVVALGASLAACSAAGTSGGASKDGSSQAAGSTATTPPPPPELPRGGRTVFPRYRLFGYSGQPDAPGQGRLGIGDLDERVVEMEKRAKPYARGRKVMPVMELISTVVSGHPGPMGTYNFHVQQAVIDEHLAVAHRHKAMLLLNIQPGTADFLSDVKTYEKYLLDPSVGLALDPEWAIDPGQRPGSVFGHTDAAEINRVTAYVAALVAQHRLPQKVVVVHQLHVGIVADQSQLAKRQGVALVKSVDGIGSPGAKIETYHAVMAGTPSFVHAGFKLFYEEDAQSGLLMTPSQVMTLKPVPEYVLFE